MDIQVHKELLPTRIEEIKKLGEELTEIGTSINALPFVSGRRSRGLNAAQLQEFQDSLLSITISGNKVMRAAVDYLQKSYDTFVEADSQ